MHRRSGPGRLALVAMLSAMPWASAAESPHLSSSFPAFEVVAEGDERAAVLEAVQPRSRPHAFSCRAPEVYRTVEATTLEDALALYLPRLRPGLTEHVVDEGPEWRLAIVEASDLMFERMSVLLVRPDGVWLLVC